jgi:DNA invertase Pin-like site-specific DNA recombinase
MAQQGKFIAYYRVSTDKQGKSGLGLEAQRQAVMNYLNGGEWKIVGEFTEVESGRRSDRPQLDAALKAARLHRAAIVVSKVDRLTRSVAFLSKLLEADVDVRFADLPQIEGPTGRFMLQQMASVAELEAGMIADRTKKALAAAKANGKKLGGSRRYVMGRDERGNKIYGDRVVMPASARMAAARVVQKRVCARADDLAPIICELQAGGAQSLRAIANGLNEAGIPTARGHGTWSAVQVRASLISSRISRPSVRSDETASAFSNTRPYPRTVKLTLETIENALRADQAKLIEAEYAGPSEEWSGRPAAPIDRGDSSALAADLIKRGSTARCEQGFNSPLQLSPIYTLCRQLIWSKGEFANEYGDPITALTV